MSTKAPIYTGFDQKLLACIESGCNTSKELTIILDEAAKPFVSLPGDEFRVVDRRLQALRKKGHIVWGRHGQNVVWRITKTAEKLIRRETDLHYAFGFGQEFARRGNAASVQAEFESEFGTGDSEAVDKFNEGVRYESARIEFGSDGLMKWKKMIPPMRWKDSKFSVVADRSLLDGSRQYMVRGSVPVGLVIDNVQVIGQDDTPQAEFFEVPRHLLD